MEEPNGTVGPMSLDNAAKEGTPPKDTASSELAFQFFIPIFSLPVIELDFGDKLIHLIRAHAPLWYVSSAVVIQLMLVAAAITYWKIWRMLKSTEFSAADTNSLLAKIGYMVMCLLFALMFYSHYAVLVAKAP